MTNKPNELMQIGLRLSNCRQDRNLTQEELAGRLGVTPQAVSKWERSISLPDVSMLSELARILDVSADWLLGLRAGKHAQTASPGSNSETAAQEQVQQEMGNCLRNCLSPLELAFGEGLVPVFTDESSFLEQIRTLKIQLAGEGIWTPVIRVRDLLSLGKTEFSVFSFQNLLYSETLDTIDERTLCHILSKLKETVCCRYHEILYPDLIKDMVDNLNVRYPALIDGIVPERISYGLLTETAKIVLAGGVSACCLPRIIEFMECALRRSPDASAEDLAEYVLGRIGNALKSRS